MDRFTTLVLNTSLILVAISISFSAKAQTTLNKDTYNSATMAAPLRDSVRVDFSGYSVNCTQTGLDKLRASIDDFGNKSDKPVLVTADSLQTTCTSAGLNGVIEDFSVDFAQSTKVRFAPDLLSGRNVSLSYLKIGGNSRDIFAAFANVAVSKTLKPDAELRLVSIPINKPLWISAAELKSFRYQKNLSLWRGIFLESNALSLLTQLANLEAFKPFALTGFLSEAVRAKKTQLPDLQLRISGEGVYGSLVRPGLADLQTRYCEVFSDNSLKVSDGHLNSGVPTNICPDLN